MTKYLFDRHEPIWGEFDPKKLPAWTNWNKVDEEMCMAGLHVPVRVDDSNGDFEICCQHCLKSMTYSEWLGFFGRETEFTPQER